MAGRQITRRRSRPIARRYAPYMTRSSVRAAWQVGQRLGKAFRAWRKRSYSKQKRRRVSRPVHAGTAGISSSGCKSYHKLYPSVRTVLRAAQLSTYKIVDTNRVEWDSGTQAVENQTVGTVEDMSLLFTNIGASSTGQDTTRMVVKSVGLKMAFTNQSNANAMVTIYDVEYRSDSYSTGDFASPKSAWSYGILREETGGDSPTYNNVGSTPYQSSDFCRCYKVVKVTKLYLDPGKSHIHYYKKIANKMLNNGMCDTSLQQTGVRGFSHACLYVCQGMPVNDGTTDTLIAYGSGAIDVVSEKVYEQCYPQYGLKRYYYDNNQGTITTEKLMNDETNAGVTYAEV